MLEIANAYGDLRQNSGAVDSIEEKLTEAGYCVLDTDAYYPSYLTNADALYTFWDHVEAQKEASILIVEIRDDGGFSCSLFQNSGNAPTMIRTEAGWNEDNQPEIVLTETYPVYDWAMTEWGTFCYQIYPEDVHYVKYGQVNLEPANREHYDMLQTYIVPIGYQFTNMFLCDWNEQNFDQLSFNDLFQYLYWMENGEVLDANQFSCPTDPSYAMIPSALFEDTVLPYFQIDLDVLRLSAMYDEQEDAYPWWPIHTNDMIHYPMLEPQVTNLRDNTDGTITITVDVGSPDLLTNRVFAHEVTIRVLESGGFQYVGNRMTYQSEYDMPPSMPRRLQE